MPTTSTSFRAQIASTICSNRSKSEIDGLSARESTERDTPDYIEVDGSKLQAKFTRTPKLSDVPYPVRMEPNLVVEFYSR